MSEAEDLAASHLGLPPVEKLLPELGALDELARRRRVHEVIRILAGASAEMQQTYRDAITDKKYIGRQDWKSALSEAKKAARGTSAHALNAPALDEHSDRLKVQAGGRNPFDVAKEVADHLLKQNSPPHLFTMGPAAVLLQESGTLSALGQDDWLAYVSERVDFLTLTMDGQRVIAPPVAVMKIIAAIILRELPPLDGVTSTPYLDTSGNLVAKDGYHPGTHLVLRMDGLALPAVNTAPSREEVTAAVRLLTEDWLGDFPFASEADRANLVAELLTLTGRELFPLVPMFVHDASTAGSGKGLLLKTVYLIAVGEPPEVMELPGDGDEQRKTVTSVLMAGKLLVAWDELHVVAGRTLAAILTAEVYSGRILSTNKLATVRNKLTQVALGNNVEARGDMKRRVWPIRLVPAQEHPEHRDDFRHPDLEHWVLANRGRLLAAVFTIWRNWFAQGCPEAKRTVGSFERWARVVGGALQASGIAGFGSNVGSWLSYSEDDDGGWSDHLSQLRRRFDSTWFTVTDVADAVTAMAIKRPPVKRDPEKDLSLQLAYSYRSQREKWHGSLRLIRSDHRDSATGSYTWTVRQRGDNPDAHAGTATVRNGPGSSPVSPGCSEDNTETAGQVTFVPSPEDGTGARPTNASPAGGSHLQHHKAAGQSQVTGDTEHTEHESGLSQTDSPSAPPETAGGLPWRSDGIAAIGDEPGRS